MEFFNCVSLNEAYEILKSDFPKRDLEKEKVFLPDSLGRVSTEDIFAPEDLPPFNRSTVDGFAVFSQDTFGASETSPALFLVSGEVVMGQKTELSINHGQAAAIPTGGMMPDAADAVVMVENTEQPDDDTLLVLSPVAPLENVVTAGEDVKKGQLILGCGSLINQSDIGILAACGIFELYVRKKIKVGIISTGDEVVDVSCTPSFGQVRDINSYTLFAMLKETKMNCQPVCYGIVKDSYEELKTVLEKAVSENEIVIISGGSSVGTRDHTVRVIEESGRQKVLFHGLLMKPGKPTILGKVKNTLVFGLPGHPVAAMTVCAKLVKYAADLFAGRQEKQKFYIMAALTRSIASAPGRDDFLRVKLKFQDGKYLAEPVMGKSGLISTMAGADGIVHVKTDINGLYAGEIVKVELF
jgi:molybdopterin molybdotransferase